MRRILAYPEVVPAVLFVLAFGLGALQSSYFLDAKYLLASTALYAETGLLILGMTFVIVSGNIDLSVASTLALVACVVAKLFSAGLPMPVAALAGLLLGCLLGAFNGLLVAYAKLPSFLVTLGTLALYRGIAQALMGTESAALPNSFVGLDRLDIPLIRVPVPFAIVLVFAVLLGLVLHRTIWGRWVFAVGTSEEAAFFSGVPTRRVRFWVFVLAGFLAAVAALTIDSRLGVARFDHARGLELDAITAVVLGGTSIQGGRGSILGSILALLLIFVVRVQMGLSNVTAEVQMTVVGTLLVFAVAVTNLMGRFAAGVRVATPE